MAESAEKNEGQSGRFSTTHWSVVLQAGRSDSAEATEALEKLCRIYWFPLYAYVRRKGHSPHDAQDLTQEFFARLLEKKYLSLADQSRGKFRSFLLTSLQHFLVNEWAKNQAVRRGGGQRLISWDEQTAEQRFLSEPCDRLTPDKIFERQWAARVIEQALEQLRKEYEVAGKRNLFEALKVVVWGEKALSSYEEIGVTIGTSEGAVKVAVHRLRQRFREILRAQVAHTVSRDEEINEELRYLISMISQ